MYVKTIKVTNSSNVLVQVPIHIIKDWNLTKEDGVEVHVSEDGKSIILKPRKGYARVQIRGSAN